MRLVVIIGVMVLLIACGGAGQGETLPESNASIKEEAEALQKKNVERHRALIAKRVQYANSLECANRIDAYQAEYEAAMDRFDLPEAGERGVLLGWLNVYYEAAKVIDAHEPDINHYCR